MDENLSWNVHVDKISENIAFGIGILREVGLLFHLKCFYLYITPWYNLISIILVSFGETVINPLHLNCRNFKIAPAIS